MDTTLSFWRERKIGLLMVGPDYAGKTKILCQLKFPGLVCQSVATTGFNAETIRIGDREFNNYADGLIFVVDSTDSDRGEEAKSALGILMQAVELKGMPLQNVHRAVTMDEIRDLFGLMNAEDRAWHIVGMSADTGKGLIEGLEWMATQLAGSRG